MGKNHFFYTNSPTQILGIFALTVKNKTMTRNKYKFFIGLNFNKDKKTADN
jgi:hypothetical protein